MNNGRDCEHGQLARSCNICELENTIAELNARVKELEAKHEAEPCDFYKHGVRDWPEDFADENGFYENICRMCSCVFMGYKRRVTCKVCATTPPKVKAEPVACKHEDDGGFIFAKCKKCGETLDDYY